MILFQESNFIKFYKIACVCINRGNILLSFQLDGGEYAMLIKEIAQKNRELRHMRGEDLQGLDLEELHTLEKLIEGSLRRLVEEKEDKIIKEINALKTKGGQLEKDNQRLKQQEMSLLAGQGHLLEPGQSSDSLGTNISSMGSVDLHQDHDNSCAFLTLGLACYTHFHANMFFQRS
ncbi:SERUM RESPONSE FACTOR-like protein [Salix koriyanagi]|uniref:SERUM RESPONSE FACTOR-like protein n=1 Tax=Salix koriyanagi TaxID=2511006 RepID=A0A9Q0ZGQ2_9ROSI|nr:SERUM RESPONSE FACTOR-like protein [Salix koriyanagi]